MDRLGGHDNAWSVLSTVLPEGLTGALTPANTGRVYTEFEHGQTFTAALSVSRLPHTQRRRRKATAPPSASNAADAGSGTMVSTVASANSPLSKYSRV